MRCESEASIPVMSAGKTRHGFALQQTKGNKGRARRPRPLSERRSRPRNQTGFGSLSPALINFKSSFSQYTSTAISSELKGHSNLERPSLHQSAVKMENTPFGAHQGNRTRCRSAVLPCRELSSVKFCVSKSAPPHARTGNALEH